MIWKAPDNKKSDTLLIHQNLSSCGWVERIEDTTSCPIFIEATDCFKAWPHRLNANVREGFCVFGLGCSELVVHWGAHLQGLTLVASWHERQDPKPKPQNMYTVLMA